jgi:retinoblastoma-like protein 1
MLRSEQARSGLPGARTLLTRWSFHQCLLACSFEMVAAAYRMGLLSFPSVPNKLRLKPFDLSKMISAFVHAEPSLPKELKRHLFTIEEKILESLAWQPGSSIYRLLEAASGDKAVAAAAQQQQPGSTAAAAAAAAGSGGGSGGAGSGQMDVDEGTPSTAAAGSGATAMDTDGAPAAAAARAPPQQPQPASSGPSSSEEQGEGRQQQDPAAKRHKGSTGAASHKQQQSAGAHAAAAQRPLPRAIGGGPGVEGPPGGDPAARAVLLEHCRKVLKLAAFRLVALR